MTKISTETVPRGGWVAPTSLWGSASALLFVGCLLYLAVVLWMVGPLPGNVDTFAFKDAAANLALGRGFTTAFNFGNPTAAALVYAGHPPAYAFLSGLWFSLFGVSVASNTWFEELLHVLLIVVLWAAIAPALAPGRRRLLALLLVLGLPAAVSGLAHDRPDVLAVIVAVAALLPFARRHDTARAALASLLAGLALTVSPLAGILATLGLMLQWLVAGPERPNLWTMAAIGLVGLLLPMALVILAVLPIDPTYPERLLAFLRDGGGAATGQENVGAGFVGLLLRDPAELFRKILASFTTLHHWLNLAVLAAAAGVVFWACLRVSARGRVRAAALAMLALLLFLCLVAFGWNRGYPTVFAVFLVALYARALPPAERPAWPLAALALIVLLSAPLTMLGLVHRASMAESLQRMERWLAEHPLPDVTGDGRVTVALDPAAHLMLKARGYDTLVWWQPSITTEELLERADAFAIGFTGTGDPLTAAYPDWWNEGLGERLYRPELPQVPTLFGRPLSRSSKTWEVEIWQARPR
ncbi:MAG TPA: glycosyltransferase family 39 protein [Kiloniellales bacterium]|nr:glycosyltransferase family 39 protein [Kiloniellales bacterium]